MRKMKQYSLYLFILFFAFIFIACGQDKKQEAFKYYKEAWEEQNYDEMYAMLSKDSKDQISKDDFVTRYQVIYDAMGAKNIQIEEIDEEKEDSETIDFQLTMDTFISDIQLDDYQMNLVEEEQGEKKAYFVEWDESLIFPQMEEQDEVRIETTAAKRGEIYDKEGTALAINGPRYSLGIHPAAFDEENVSRIADILDIDAELIQKELDQNTNPEHFVPIVKLAVEEEDLMGELLTIEGVLRQEVEDRIYPAGAAFGVLTGYIHPITAEELEEMDEEIYNANSEIGKAGLELVYEEELRALDGKEIYISKIEEGEEVERISLAKKEAENGQDIQLTLDSNLQQTIYEETKEEVGTASAVDPLTGKVRALVSYPSYDPNLYRTYTPDSLREQWEEMEASPFENRFNKAYSPGSAFKLVTGAIGLKEEVLQPHEKLRIESKAWQKDSSWGDYKVQRVSQELTQLDLKDAFIYSDNIYFAQKALRIGADSFIERSKEFGFGEDFPFKYPFVSSQIANDGTIGTEVLLADTGYGQGEILMSSLHLGLIYGALVNDGQMMMPQLEEKEAEVWKENLYSEENRQVLLDSLIAVIEDSHGTGRAAKIDGLKLAGKTGTAEFKLSQTESGKENGWFVAMNIDEPEIVISMMIEDVEDRGGSQYPLEKVKNVLLDYFEQ